MTHVCVWTCTTVGTSRVAYVIKGDVITGRFAAKTPSGANLITIKWKFVGRRVWKIYVRQTFPTLLRGGSTLRSVVVCQQTTLWRQRHHTVGRCRSRRRLRPRSSHDEQALMIYTAVAVGGGAAGRISHLALKGINWHWKVCIFKTPNEHYVIKKSSAHVKWLCKMLSWKIAHFQIQTKTIFLENANLSVSNPTKL